MTEQHDPSSWTNTEYYLAEKEINEVEDNKKHKVQEGGGFNDWPFAVLFILHLGVMGFTAAKYVPLMEESIIDEYYGNNRNRRLSYNYSDFEVSLRDVLFLILWSGGCGLLLNLAALPLLMYCSGCIIYFMLAFSITITLTVGILGAFYNIPTLAIAGFVAWIFSAYYAWVVWTRIPFTAVNLKVACTALLKNAFGLSFFGFGSDCLLFGWTIWWSLSTISAIYAQMRCVGRQCEYDPNPWLVCYFLFCFFWTHQVVKNHLHVTVAGAVGSWWFSPEQLDGCCNSAVRGSFFRASTFSFGSICLGSLLVAVVQTLKDFLDMLRNHDDQVLLCCAECLLGCIEFLIEYFNKWAFVFVGLYGYPFMEAGKNVITLFKDRGWTTIITDSLVDSILTMVSVCIGLITGILAGVLANNQQMLLGEIAPWIIGFFVGFMLASTLMSLLASAVNTVIVCFAEAPNELKKNHPHLSHKMIHSWRKAWPNDFQFNCTK